MTWGGQNSGGDSSGVKEQLKGVQQVEGTKKGFVAILADGSVVTWDGSWFLSDSCASMDRSGIAAQVAYL